jgi:hypothetical protein
VLRPIARATLKTTGALLVVFHLWLFARDAWAGQLLDFGLLARWTVAAGLVWGLAVLRRQGASMVRGRKAVAIWVLAALLHGPALAGRVAVPDLPVAPVAAAWLVPAIVGTAAAAGLLILLGLAGSWRQRLALAPRRQHRSLTRSPGALAPGAHLPFAQRPPPRR